MDTMDIKKERVGLGARQGREISNILGWVFIIQRILAKIL